MQIVFWYECMNCKKHFKDKNRIYKTRRDPRTKEVFVDGFRISPITHQCNENTTGLAYPYFGKVPYEDRVAEKLT